MPGWRGSWVGYVVLAGALMVHVPARAGDPQAASWKNWGGPTQDFRAPAGEIAASWPEDGPPIKWTRSLGGGYSAILVEAGHLYTMYRSGDEEIVICLSAASGDTIWEFRYEHPPGERHISGYGNGPNSTPVIAGDQILTIGVAGRMHALNKHTGKVAWTHELWGERFTGKLQGFGYSSSPVVYKDSVIVPLGGEGAGLVALNLKDGAVKWSALDFNNSYSSPRLMNILGEQQVVVFMAEELIGVNPDDGELRWRYPHVNQWEHNITIPEVAGDTIFLSSPQAGARGLQFSRVDGEIQLEEIWSNRRIQFYHGSSIREGDWVYGSTGTVALTFMAAVNIRTGEIGWRERGFAKANVVEASGFLVVLDEDGALYLVKATPEEMVVKSRFQLSKSLSWTVPTIVGTTMYVRNTSRILAVDLS
jgi:outer membrane protein assembly factor BamB